MEKTKNMEKNKLVTFEATPWTGKVFNVLFSPRTWKILFLLTFMLTAYVSYRMFVANYALTSPVIKKGVVIDQYKASNELALCNADLEAARAGKQTAIEANNQDILPPQN